ncbi:hypothetical protein EON81_07325 [bacterium]|nr:MAG: hypothetical protein EON81_07325 [bacterium]
MARSRLRRIDGPIAVKVTAKISTRLATTARKTVLPKGKMKIERKRSAVNPKYTHDPLLSNRRAMTESL